MIAISADYEVAAPASDTGKLKKEVTQIEHKIGKVNS